jgi:hypothetical protein
MSRLALTLTLAAALIACEDNDIGRECTGMVVPVPSGGSSEGDVMRAQGSEIIEYNAQFPCSTTVCVATLGRGAYCSQECTRDEDCPSAFECREIMSLGPFAGQQLCAWKRCTSSGSCGDPDEFICSRVEELSLGEIVRLCDFRPE